MSIRQIPTIDYLRQCFRYENGKLFWLNRPDSHFRSARSRNMWNSKFSGKEAGQLSALRKGRESRKGRRWVIGLQGTTFLRSRLVWALHHGYSPAMVDHENRNTVDDRIENLRPASQGQNAVNSKRRTDNTSGTKGVSWHKRVKKWAAKVTVMQKQIHLGYFDDLDTAISVRVAAFNKHFGKFAREN